VQRLGFLSANAVNKVRYSPTLYNRLNVTVEGTALFLSCLLILFDFLRFLIYFYLVKYLPLLGHCVCSYHAIYSLYKAVEAHKDVKHRGLLIF
jgi:hypothetical protein